MNSKFSVSIPKPCTEKWNGFTPTPMGGFCSSCSKTVVDFTRMSDNEIITFLKRNTNACGRFRPDQLKTYTNNTIPKINPGFNLFKAGLLSLLLLLLSKQTSAQSVNPKTNTESVQHSNHLNNETTTATSEQVVKGLVLSGDDEPLPGANIYLKGSTVGTVADAEGRFEFPQKLKEGDVLVFAFIGLTTEEFTIPKKTKKEDLEIRMVCDYAITGEVNTTGVYASHETGFRKLWSTVKRIF
jgi:hypothetical protein